jgi:hypothetical protein
MYVHICTLWTAGCVHLRVCNSGHHVCHSHAVRAAVTVRSDSAGVVVANKQQSAACRTGVLQLDADAGSNGASARWFSCLAIAGVVRADTAGATP